MIANSTKIFGVKIDQIKLFILAILVSCILMGADSSYTGRRLIYYIDHFNHLKLTASAVNALEKGQFPIRTGEGISEGTGLAIHQFYSPGAHAFIAFFVLLVRDLFFGYLLAMILMSILAFIYSFKLVKYLTCSDIIAIIGAFIYVTGPYLATNRVLRAAIPEYMAMCILPMILYFHLKAIVNRKYCYIFKAVILTAWLFLIHLITAVFFYFFYFIFLFILLCYFLITKKIDKKIYLNKFYKRMKILILIVFLVTLLDLYYLLPIILYNDLYIKISLIPSSEIYYSAYLVPLISIISIRDIIYPVRWLYNSTRLQIGFFIFISYISYIYYNITTFRSIYSWPLIITSSFILYIIIEPIIFVGPLKIFNFAQFSYRFLAHFQLISMVMGSLALFIFWKLNKNYLFPQKLNFALIIIISSLILVCPYLYPASFVKGFPKFIKEEDITESKMLENINNAYLRVSPNFLSQSLKIPTYTNSEVLTANYVKNSAEHVFIFNLAKRNSVLTKSRELYFDVLYYPLLMDIEASIDGKPINPGIETFWRSRDGFGDSRQSGNSYFHGLKLTGLPNTGILKVDVKFIGSKIGNWISLLTLLLLLCYFYFNKYYNNKNLHIEVTAQTAQERG
jgi:hypothetical protein